MANPHTKLLERFERIRESNRQVREIMPDFTILGPKYIGEIRKEASQQGRELNLSEVRDVLEYLVSTGEVYKDNNRYMYVPCTRCNKHYCTCEDPRRK